MPNSSHRTDKGPPPALPVPVPLPPEADSDSVWNDDAFHIPSGPTPTESLEAPVSPKPSAGDNQPTVISRPPSLTGSGEHQLGSLRGRRLAHFELIAPIGIGGMAAVIKGRDLQLDRIVALKVLPPEMASDPENIRRFHQEARAAAKLDHENIARVFFYGEDQKLHFIAFEFVQGDNLRTILERRGRLPVGEALHYILQVTTGLAHASSRGVVHRDIKPSNIIITPTGRAKLVDMGLARTQIPQDERQLTQSGVTLGTFDYISPEQAMEPREADVRSDIYSLGCTFYHLLTGQPPVPEGTAAKKLHFHEHEFPVDPRQLNPDVPDEVAAILSRMMAKNPRDRYQKPEHLVEELLRVAHKVEAGGERTDGLLYVDAPMPSRPARPLIFVALAIAAVIALVFAVEQPAQQRSSPPAPRGPALRGPDAKGQPEVTPPRPPEGKGDPPRDVPPVPVAETPTFTWNGPSQRAELLAFSDKYRTGQAEIRIVLNADLDLSGTGTTPGEAALTLSGKKITIESGDRERPAILLDYKGEGRSLTTALSLQAEQVVLRGLRVVVTGVGAELVGMTGVKIVGGREHEVVDCHFQQRYPSYSSKNPLISLLLDGSRDGQRPRLSLRECAFIGKDAREMGQPADPKETNYVGRGGQYAVARRGAGDLVVSNCVFGPHQGCIRLEGDGANKARADDVQVLNSSALLSDGSALFNLEDEASSRINVRFSLFSRPQPRGEEAAAVLIRQGGKTEGREAVVHYSGENNRYHGLDGFWVEGSREQPAGATWKDFQERKDVSDRPSAVLDRSPWKDPQPLSALRQFDLLQAFSVKLQMPELRVKEGRDEVLLGVQKCGLHLYANGKLPPVEGTRPPEMTRKEKTVDPSIQDTGNNIFKTLNQALDETRAGDIILIKHNGELPLNPLVPKAGLDVTIKPVTGFRPVLTLATTKKEKDTALFQLHEGRIEFQNLEFLLKPSQKEFTAQAVVALGGDGICTFKDCTIRMSEPQGCQLAAVMLGDPAALMRSPVRPGEVIPAGPTLIFERCLVCGKGDLVWCRASQPFKLEVKQTALALSGSLLAVEGSKFAETLPGPGAIDPGARCTIDLEHVTALVAGPLFHLRPTTDFKSLVPIKCKVSSSLLAPLGSNPLVVVSGLNGKASDTEITERLSWGGTKNVYGNFMGLLEQQPGNLEMKPPKFDREKWKDLTGETESRFLDQIKFVEMIDSATLQGLRPSQLAVADLKDVGANLGNLPDPKREESK